MNRYIKSIMNHITVIGSVILVFAIACVMLFVYYNRVEGFYIDKYVQMLDGNTYHYIELKNGEIRHYSYFEFSNGRDYLGIVGSYKPLNNGWIELTYKKHGVFKVKVLPNFYGLELDELDAVATDLELPNYERLYFWDFW